MTLNGLRISNNSLTAMKLIGIAAMLADHFNALVNPDYNQILFEIGRIAFPLFALTLGYNLARIPSGKIPKIMLRLLMFGIVATPVYIILGGGLQHWWPLNILFTLSLATTIVYLLSLPTYNRWTVTSRKTALLLFVVVGGLVDYLWLGPALVVVVWRLFSGISAVESTILQVLLSGLFGLLCVMNDSLATLLALPIIYLAIVTCQNIRLPRMKWFFYWFYPGHLVALFLIRTAFY
ncbi:TraX family protein [Denitrificimonas sp. JX-1]|uniref:TraX family protein n=1 Tax=Denitrificimonas halotolerans TaxID=3098930 RepID=A0ABU5GNF0_9GAMM|nr:TraX family protein [Denitrificimonas sp. JX-1]MDY7218468.1 TraX family protein [Denitrificimonas sp. JX-1]